MKVHNINVDLGALSLQWENTDGHGHLFIVRKCPWPTSGGANLSGAKDYANSDLRI